MIWSLVRKPGAFARYVYREEMFPTLTFRRAYDAICGNSPSLSRDLEYLRVLHLAASNMQADVEAALIQLLADGTAMTSDAVKALAKATDNHPVPSVGRESVDLAVYDGLLSEVAR